MATDYWTASLEEMLPDYDIDLGDRFAEFVNDVRMCAQMEFEASGREHIPNPLKADVDRLKQQIRSERDRAGREFVAEQKRLRSAIRDRNDLIDSLRNEIDKLERR